MRLVLTIAALLIALEAVAATQVYRRQQAAMAWTSLAEPLPVRMTPAPTRRPPGRFLPAHMVAQNGLNHEWNPDRRWQDFEWVNEEDVKAENARLAAAQRADQDRMDAMERAGRGLGDRR